VPSGSLTIKQENFCQDYVTSGDASKAYRSAYKAGKMKPATINRNAATLLKSNKIATRVNELKSERCERTKIDADYVLMRHVEIDVMDVIDIMDDAGNVLPIRQWPKVWRQTISGIDLHELVTKDTLTIIKKIKWPDKTRNLELLGKHVDVQAYKDKVEVEGKIDMAAVLIAARKRLEKR